MRNQLPTNRRSAVVVVAVAAIVFINALMKSRAGQTANLNPSPAPAVVAAPTVALSAGQLDAIKIATVGTHLFPMEKEAVGNIDFDEDRSVQVYPAYPGKLLQAFVTLGDDVQKGQPLYSIDSPDLVQAESTLIGTAATVGLTSSVLARARVLYATNGVSKAELEQDIAAEATAEGALKAARNAVRIFGKTEAEMDDLVATGKIDSVMNVLSPLTGQITSLSAPPGCLVQPGTPPAPCSVADAAVKWLVAYVIESDSPFIRVGQPLRATVMALPDRVFAGRVSKLGAALDPNTRRLMVRCEMADPNHELTPGMLASFVIRIQDPVSATAVPAAGVVREGDGTFSAWVTTDHQHFTQRQVQPGMRSDGWVQIIAGLHPGETAVTDGAVFLSNILFAPPGD